MSRQVQDAYIVAATRTPIGKAPKGVLRNVRPDDLLVHAIRSAVAQVPGLDPATIEDVIAGCAMPEAEQGLNVARVAALLDAHAAVKRVYWPGLPTHPGHALAARQQDGFGAMLSFELVGGEASARIFVEGLEYFTLAESLGGVESLVCHPAGMTHAAMAPEARRRAGIADGLLRISVGIEDEADLHSDIEAALDRVSASLPARATSAA